MGQEVKRKGRHICRLRRNLYEKKIRFSSVILIKEARSVEAD